MSKLKERINERSPILMTAFGIIGFGFAIYNAVKAKGRIDKEIEQKKEEQDLDILPKKEVAKIVAKNAWPTAVIFGASCACTISGQAISVKRNAAIAGACVLYENAYRDIREATREVVGEKKMDHIDNKVAEKKVRDYHLCEENVFYTGLGNTLCMEGMTGRYFRTNVNHIDNLKKEINVVLDDNGSASMSDYFDILRLPDTPIGSMGWDKNSMELLMSELDIDREAVVTESGEPCLVIMPSVMPTWDYWDRF